ncbi:putative Glycosyltransferase RgtA/B/C/D-like domain-containing protein [Pararobbsia alpina]|uniref:hypothetical protein n=1 Tax=Pararobbsia alpina TaxID=621374 RepID=UPI0039A4CB65
MKLTPASATRQTIPLLCALLVAIVAVVGLWVWHQLPIYPDEIALKISRGRFIQDHGIAYGLYRAMCPDTVRTTPLLFVPSAWLLSWASTDLTPQGMRILPAGVVLGSFAFAIVYALRRYRVSSAFFMLGALVGVAGSGLILARHEFAAELNVLICFVALAVLERASLPIAIRLGIACLLAFSGVFSLSVHVQGVLFIPLTALLIYRLIQPIAPRWLPIPIVLVYAGIVIWTAFAFQAPSCTGHPEIEKFWRDMTYSKAPLGAASVWRYLASSYAEYLQTFFYAKDYAIHYLPPVVVESSSQQKWLDGLNDLIAVALSFNALMLVLITIIGAGVFFAGMFRLRGRSLTSTLHHCLVRHEIALAAIAAPILFLFVYDPLHNFYRTFFLNFVASFVVAVSLSRLNIPRPWSWIRIGMASVVTVCAVASIFANATWFATAFEGTSVSPGYEGPSVSVNHDPAHLEGDVRALEAECHIDPKKGGAVVDDMTYEAFKRTQEVYAITYIYLMGTLTHRTSAQVLEGTSARFTLARCSMMNDARLPFSHQHGDLCCLDLTGK